MIPSVIRSIESFPIAQREYQVFEKEKEEIIAFISRVSVYALTCLSIIAYVADVAKSFLPVFVVSLVTISIVLAVFSYVNRENNKTPNFFSFLDREVKPLNVKERGL